MAKLKIYGDIKDEEGKNAQLYFTGVDSVCFRDIDNFLESMKPDDDTIDIGINCRGGLISEGLAIYDKLRTSGKKIITTVEGSCASMAMTILLAAPKENRRSTANAQFLIHNPIVIMSDADVFNADGLAELTQSLTQDAEMLLSQYVDRTGTDTDILKQQMEIGTWFNATKAKELGFISTILTPTSALKTNNMSKNQTIKSSLLERILAKAGFSKIEDLQSLNMELSTADGNTLTIEKEEGEPIVGDEASPDGEHVMPDGTKIIVTDGVITEIIKEETSPETTEELKAKISELEAKLAAASTSKQTMNKTDLAILNAVKIAGGEAWLAKQCSTYKPSGKAFAAGSVEGKTQGEPSSNTRARVEALRNRG